MSREEKQLKRLRDAAGKIRLLNQQDGRGRLPLGDTMYARHMTDIFSSPEEMQQGLKMLEESHYLFRITLVAGSDLLRTRPTHAYVFADPVLMSQLREYAFKELELVYEYQLYRRKDARMIIRELEARRAEYNNTVIGRALNLAIELQNQEQFMTMRPNEFSFLWKETRLRSYVARIVEGDVVESRRAIDTVAAKLPNAEIGGEWGEMVRRYGVQFIARVHLRKYQFGRIKALIYEGKIKDERDLKFVHDTLATMETQTERDPNLKAHALEMVELRALIQQRLTKLAEKAGNPVVPPQAEKKSPDVDAMPDLPAEDLYQEL